MRAILDHCQGVPVVTVADGTELLAEGQKTGRVYVLVQGRIEILRGGTQVTVLDEPGSVVGEMSLLLDSPHTASARALGEVHVHAIADAAGFFNDRPALSWLVATLLAKRLNAATTYLVDLKRQFAHHGDHLEMVAEILETLIHQQDRDFRPGSTRDPGRA